MLVSLVLLCFASNAFAALSDYDDWQPDSDGGYTYCDAVQTGSDAFGYACGNSSYTKMTKNDSSISIASNSSLGLLSVGWMNSRTLSTESGWWQTCRSYLVQLYDNLYADTTGQYCPFTYPTLSGIGSCTSGTNLIIRKGYGYCMSEAVCGATVPIYFLKNPTPDTTGQYSILYAYEADFLAYFPTFTNVTVCYGFSLVQHGVGNDSVILSSY